MMVWGQKRLQRINHCMKAMVRVFWLPVFKGGMDGSRFEASQEEGLGAINRNTYGFIFEVHCEGHV
jgi:hypothetical protein